VKWDGNRFLATRKVKLFYALRGMVLFHYVVASHEWAGGGWQQAGKKDKRECSQRTKTGRAMRS